jgi:hypothetical protein
MLTDTRCNNGASHPNAGLAVGDVLLAQKIALETMEIKAPEIANRQMFRM